MDYDSKMKMMFILTAILFVINQKNLFNLSLEKLMVSTKNLVINSAKKIKNYNHHVFIYWKNSISFNAIINFLLRHFQSLDFH